MIDAAVPVKGLAPAEATQAACRAAGAETLLLKLCPSCGARYEARVLLCSLDGEVLVEDPEALVGATLYSTMEPCPMCLSAIYWARLDRLYFAASREDAAEIGFDDAFLYREIPLAAPDRRLPSIQALRDEARAMMLPWKQIPSERRY